MTTAPEQFLVVDGNAYWIEGPALIDQPGGAPAIKWPAAATLMHAPLTLTGEVAWKDAEYVDAVEPEQVSAIIAALTETIVGISLAHAVA